MTATAVAGLACLVGLVVCGASRRLHVGGRGGWAIVVLAVTGVAWSLAVVSAWLPTGACS